MTRRLRVLLYLKMDISHEHGTAIWARSYLRSLARVRDVEFIAVFSGPASTNAASQEFVERLGLRYIFIPNREPANPGNTGILGVLSSAAVQIYETIVEKYYFWGELECRKQPHVEPALIRIITEAQPDLVVVSHMGAAVQTPSVFDLSTPCCLICLNNETRLYGELKSLGGFASMGRTRLWIFQHFNWIANTRARAFITGIYGRCAGVVTLTTSDMPTNLSAKAVRAVIPPILDRSPRQWHFEATRRLLFVGSIFYGTALHFPNWSAIEWICSKLAPQIAQFDAGVMINVIGAEKPQVPSSWHFFNINFMGRSDRDTLVHQMTTADLFIAPIANSYGSKLKLAECVSHGTPFAATEGAMSGLPFIPWVPRLHLDEPQAAARTVLEHMNNPDRLKALSESILIAAAQARTGQDLTWRSFLASAAKNPGMSAASS